MRDSDLSTWGKGILGRGGGENKGPESMNLTCSGNGKKVIVIRVL